MADNDTNGNTHAIALHLVEAHALALAQFVRRVGWSEFITTAVDEAQAREMQAAVDALQRALAEAGFATPEPVYERGTPEHIAQLKAKLAALVAKRNTLMKGQVGGVDVGMLSLYAELALNHVIRYGRNFAHFVKRVGRSEFRTNAVVTNDRTRAAVGALQRALAEAGFAPR